MGALSSTAPLPGAIPLAEPSVQAPTAKSWRMRTHLAVLVATCVLPGALVSTSLVMQDYEQSRARAMREVVSQARTAAAHLDRDLAGITAGLQVLATSQALAQDDLAAFHGQARAALPFQNVTNHVLIDAQGAQKLNTIQPWGTPLPEVGGPPSLLEVFRGQAPHLTDLFTGPVTGKPILALGVPVMRDGKVVYALNAGIFPERFMGALQAQSLPAHWTGAVLDTQGRVVARSRDMDRFVGKMAVPDLVQAIRQQKEGLIETRTLDGVPVVTGFSRSRLSGWTVVIGIPQQELIRDLKQNMLWLVTSTLVLYAALLWLVWRMSMKRIVQPARQLLSDMRHMAQGELPQVQAMPHVPLEMEALSQGFANMSAQLRQRDQERDTALHRLSTTLDSIHDCFCLLDESWRLVHVNRRSEALMGRPREELIGQSLWSLLSPADALALRGTFEQAMTEQQAIHFDAHLPGLGLWLELHLYPSDSGLSVYAQDTSGLREMRQAQEARRVAEASNRAKTEFLSRMSHELRTPLNAVLGFAQVLQLDTVEPLTVRQRGMLDHITSSGQHLLAMISDVLDVSRIEAGSLHIQTGPIHVNALLQHGWQMVQTQAHAAQVHVVMHADPEAPWVLADKTRLTQVLLNLLSNAIKYNRPSGTVSLITERQGDQVSFRVEDTGIGLSPDQLTRLFEPFNRLGREASGLPGTGIGLVICQGLLGLMGSELVVQSVAGQGSVFSFRLPLATPDPALPDPTPPATLSTQSREG